MTARIQAMTAGIFKNFIKNAGNRIKSPGAVNGYIVPGRNCCDVYRLAYILMFYFCVEI